MTVADELQVASLVLSSISLVVVILVSWKTLKIGQKSVESAQRSEDAATTGVRIAETEAARRRLERIGELIIQTHLAARTAKAMEWNDNKEVVDLQVRLRVALTGLEDQLPRAKEMAWTESMSPAGVGQVESLWQHALDEVVRGLHALHPTHTSSLSSPPPASDAERPNR